MNILGLQYSHDSSMCVIENNKIIFYQEEQMLSGVKRDDKIINLWSKIKDKEFDVIVVTSISMHEKEFNLRKINIDDNCKTYNIKYKKIIQNTEHHLQHAACAFYNSNFDKAYCLVLDGAGNTRSLSNGENVGFEIESIFKFDRINNTVNEIWKICSGISPKKHTDNLHSVNSLSMGGLFLSAARIYASQEAGGVMGMASYGKRKIKKADCFFVKDNVWSVNQEFIAELIDKENNNVFNYSKIIQEESTKIILSKIDMILEKDKDANICLSGGVFQNCHINSEVLKKHKKVFVDPIAHDGGTSMGAALLIASQHNEKIEPYKNLYLGHKEKHVFDDDFKDKHKTSPEEVAKLIHENNLVGIFQGKAEGGPRALGNRSLLFNPHNLHGKELVNIFKKRKWYRPYAGTVLHEYCHEWFNLYGKDETPFMSYAVEVIENKRRIIPAITHVDGTCRVQTLKKNQNENFYNLINSFFKLTNIPVVLNTSLNLAGKPLVNTLNDATALLNHGLDYLYLPETNILLKSKF